MFVRFRQTARRLQVSLSATSRSDGRVRHEHVAGLGSVPLSPSVADRAVFWTKLHQRLDTLGNRLDAAQRTAIMTAVYARIPMPTADDQQADLLVAVRSDAAMTATVSDMLVEELAALKNLAASMARRIAETETKLADTKAIAQTAADRVARAERGEPVAVPPPRTRKDMLRMLGWTAADAQHAETLIRIHALGGEEVENRLVDMAERRGKTLERAVARELLASLIVAA